jgi:hypothetical protein
MKESPLIIWDETDPHECVGRDQFGKIYEQQKPVLPNGSAMEIFVPVKVRLLKSVKDDYETLKKGTLVDAIMLPSGHIHLCRSDERVIIHARPILGKDFEYVT